MLLLKFVMVVKCSNILDGTFKKITVVVDYVHDENFTLIDQVFVTEHLVSRFQRMEVYNDHVLRHHEISTNTQQAQQWKSAVSDHGVVVVEFRNVL